MNNVENTFAQGGIPPLPPRLYATVYSTVCPRNSDQLYIVTYYIKWVTTSWTHSI